jgi:ferredoxin
MANAALRLPENIPGDFFVDSTCIDCDACRQIAPATFSDAGDTSIVHHQPDTEPETRRALMALVACPTASIGTVEHHDAHIGIDAFPSRIAENVYFCGFTAESSFGAWSYLIVRPESDGGNVLIHPASCQDRSFGWSEHDAADASRRRRGSSSLRRKI